MTSTPEIVPGSGSLTSPEYDALRRDIKTIGEHVVSAMEAQRASDERIARALDELRQDLAMRDHRFAETTLKLHQDTSQKHEVLKLALEALDERIAAQHADDMAWKERFKARLLDLQDRATDREEEDVIVIPGVHASWTWWRKSFAVGALVVAGSLISSGLTACAARGGFLDASVDASEIHR